jgi:hypothetical protein
MQDSCTISMALPIFYMSKDSMEQFSEVQAEVKNPRWRLSNDNDNDNNYLYSAHKPKRRKRI